MAFPLNLNLLRADRDYKDLCLAAASKNYYKALQLVDKVRDLTKEHKCGDDTITPLYVAAVSGSVSIFKLILRKAPDSINFFHGYKIKDSTPVVRTIIWKSMAEICTKGEGRASDMFYRLEIIFDNNLTEKESLSLAYEFKNAYNILATHRAKEICSIISETGIFVKGVDKIIADYATYSIDSDVCYSFYQDALDNSLERITKVSRVIGVSTKRIEGFMSQIFNDLNRKGYTSRRTVNSMINRFRIAREAPLPLPIRTERAEEVREQIRAKEPKKAV